MGNAAGTQAGAALAAVAHDLSRPSEGEAGPSTSSDSTNSRRLWRKAGKKGVTLCLGPMGHEEASQGNVAKLMEVLSACDSYDLPAHERIIARQDLFGATMLHRAVLGKHVEAVRLLLLSGSSSSIRDDRGRTALHYAVATGQLDIVSMLLTEPSCDVNAVDFGGWTAVVHAWVAEKFEIVTLLVAHGASMAHADSTGSSIVHYAAYQNLTQIIACCRNSTDTPLTHCNRQGFNAHHICAWGLQSDFLSSMAESEGLLVSSRACGGDILKGFTPLHFSCLRLASESRQSECDTECREKVMECIEIMLIHGGDVTSLSHFGITPFDLISGSHDDEHPSEFEMVCVSNSPWLAVCIEAVKYENGRLLEEGEGVVMQEAIKRVREILRLGVPWQLRHYLNEREVNILGLTAAAMEPRDKRIDDYAELFIESTDTIISQAECGKCCMRDLLEIAGLGSMAVLVRNALTYDPCEKGSLPSHICALKALSDSSIVPIGFRVRLRYLSVVLMGGRDEEIDREDKLAVTRAGLSSDSAKIMSTYNYQVGMSASLAIELCRCPEYMMKGRSEDETLPHRMNQFVSKVQKIWKADEDEILSGQLEASHFDASAPPASPNTYAQALPPSGPAIVHMPDGVSVAMPEPHRYLPPLESRHTPVVPSSNPFQPQPAEEEVTTTSRAPEGTVVIEPSPSREMGTNDSDSAFPASSSAVTSAVTATPTATPTATVTERDDVEKDMPDHVSVATPEPHRRLGQLPPLESRPALEYQPFEGRTCPDPAALLFAMPSFKDSLVISKEAYCDSIKILDREKEAEKKKESIDFSNSSMTVRVPQQDSLSSSRSFASSLISMDDPGLNSILAMVLPEVKEEVGRLREMEDGPDAVNRSSALRKLKATYHPDRAPPPLRPLYGSVLASINSYTADLLIV